ncbi:hypothetical protein BRADI_1g21585v3 [Brachypodium distachyon]|uniref:Uncharacterized protein n=1 Tax=Brachypodium distachyon TaxID=15368 RepID=A0A2K2DKH2_BRADI|nr:hypothetical protein BRADI_1g21585v3 [Brachypodium distachyon]
MIRFGPRRRRSTGAFPGRSCRPSASTATGNWTTRSSASSFFFYYTMTKRAAVSQAAVPIRASSV